MPFTNKQSVILDSFEGGRNTKANTANVPLFQSPDELNVVYDEYGAVRVRNGYTKYNSAAIASAAIDGLFSYKPATMSAQLIVGCNGNIQVATGTATAFQSIGSATSLFTAGVMLEILQFQDLCIFTNGNQQPYKFNGNEFTRLGVSAPTQTLTAICDAAAGNLNGTYTYVYTGVNSYLAEGDYGVVSTARAITSGSVRVNNIPTAPVSHGINSWNIYRNTAGVQGTYWLVTAVTNGVTSFTDNVADSSLTTAAPTDQGYPRYFKYCVHYGGRLWGAGDSNKDFLWFSNINQPEEFPSTNFIRIGKGDGMDISGLAVLSGNIVITKSDWNGRTAVYLLFVGDVVGSSDPVNWNLIKADSPEGSDSHRVLTNYSQSLLMLNRNGVYSFQGRDLNLNQSETSRGALAADSASFDIEPDIQTLTSGTTMAKAAGINWKNKVWISSPNNGTTNNDIMYVFDYVRSIDADRKQGAWSKHDSIYISKMTIHEGALVGGNSGTLANGRIYNLDTGSTDDGSSINARFVTAPIKGNKGHEGFIKDWRWAYVTVDCISSENIGFQYSTDFSDFCDVTNYSLTASGNESIKTIKMPIVLAASVDDGTPVRGYGRMIQLKFTNPANASTAPQIVIRKIEVFYTLRGLR